MKRWILVVLILLVIAAHALIFLIDWGGEDATPGTVGVPASERVSGEEAAPVETTEPPTADPKIESESSSSDETEERIAETVARMKSEASAPESPIPSDSDSARPDEIPEGAMKVGLVDGTATLPPEVTEIAQKGAMAVAAGNWEEARGHYIAMVKAAPNNALAYANLGVAEHQLGNLLAASGNLKRSLELNPSIAQNWQTLGIIHYERGELELAISSLTRAIHEAPSDARSRLYLSAVVRDYGCNEASVIELERAIDSDPTLADAHFNLALTYLDQKPPRIELAKRHYYSAIDLGAPKSEEIEEFLAQASEDIDSSSPSPGENAEGGDDF